MSASTTTRSLGEALRHVALPRHENREALFSQRFDWQRDEVRWHFQLNRQAQSGGWMHAVMGERTVCLRVAAQRQQRIGERDWSDYGGDAQLMAWTLAHDDLLNTLREVLGGPFTPISIISSPQLAAPELAANALDFDIPGSDNVSWRGTLAVDEKTCDALIDQSTASPLPRASSGWPALPLPIALRCDGPVIESSKLRLCDGGDMIVLGDQRRLLERVVACAAGGQRLPVLCQIDDSGVRIALDKNATSADLTTKETLTMSQTPPVPQDETSLASQIPVRLSIQTAAVDISLAELEQMESGMVVPLEVPVAGTNVTVLANGTPVGDGELVAAGDKLAVCIRRWRPDGL